MGGLKLKVRTASYPIYSWHRSSSCVQPDDNFMAQCALKRTWAMSGTDVTTFSGQKPIAARRLRPAGLPLR